MIDIKHKHAGHLITIEGHPFKANDAGQWDLTEIWQTLRLPKGKQPKRFVERKEAQRLEQAGKIGSLNRGRAGSQTLAAKQAVIRYAAWVSPEFEDMVFDAFEAILELPEVMAAVADQMRTMGYRHSAALLEREKDIRREALRALKKGPRPPLTAEQKESRRLSRLAYAEANKARRAGRKYA
ncbi:hypothetical protein DN820_17570 [Stutzerimonas nosocomialis]|uniref:KilA-N domain-containing protein n=1 Tax=Stutzerimonas nosocomialis TaxID=1056496 RepID=A0A5R9QAX6_9GAMM|nr:hypothetical protein [Stutzerimonas nosocomialis]TLX62140.1 hypothetical protein DN820_17570 [Stutzerimonas nosocomialis]